MKTFGNIKVILVILKKSSELTPHEDSSIHGYVLWPLITVDIDVDRPSAVIIRSGQSGREEEKRRT